MHNPYVTYFQAQAGGGNVFAGPVMQKSQGLGDLFKSFFQFLRPILIPAVKTVGREALTAGAGALTDVLAGSSVKEATKKRLKTVGTNLAEKALHHLTQSGQGRKKKNKRRRKPDIFDHHDQLKRSRLI